MSEKRERGCLIFPFHKLILIMSCCSSLPPLVDCKCNKKPVIFNFGDSNSDTGGFFNGLGISFGPPNGRIFSHHRHHYLRQHYHHEPAGRLCDGQLIIDFLCESLHTHYLTPYLESLGPNFTNGVNFAISGSSTLPRFLPFSLDVQVLQFLRFRARSLRLVSKGYKNLVGDDEFKSALYTIDTGQNDLAGSFFYLSYLQVIQRIPSFIAEIKDAIWSIYQHGGKYFWVHNTGPLGCFPQKVAGAAGNARKSFDHHGCLNSLNNAAKAFNKQLHALCQELRSEMRNAIIVYVDMYAIKYHLIANSAKYGFENPFIACCGYGGPPYNYNPNVTCGQPGYNVCNEESKFISWDGVHYTEASNKIFASKILSTKYSTPRIKFDYFCNT